MDTSQLIQQAQQFQQKISEMQAELTTKTITSTVGGGMVTVTVNGKSEIIELKIDKEVIKAEEQEMLQDMIAAAVNDAVKKSKDLMQAELGKMTGGLGINIPGLFG